MAIRFRQMGIAKSAAILTVGGMIEFLLQFLIPVVLVRNLDTAAFGQYRLLALMLGTALALAPAFMPQSLYFFLPVASEERKRAVIGNVILYLAIMGAIVAVVASPFNAAGGTSLHRLFHDTHGASSIFLGLSVLLSITTTLATAEGRIIWQFSADLGIAIARTALIALTAIFTHELAWVVGALVVEATLRMALAIAYLHTRPGGGRINYDPALMGVQLRYAIPFGVGVSLYVLRVQCDQWIAAAMFSGPAFAAFTIGAVVLPVGSLIRQPINSAMLPRLSAAFAAGRRAEVHRLLLKGSSAATLLLVPISATLFALAPEIVELVYTVQYLPAVPVMRAYLVLIMMQSFAIGYAMPMLDLGKLSVRINAAGLAASVCASLVGAWCFGLVGAALGSVVAFALSESLNLHVIAKQLGRSFGEMFPLRLLFITAGAVGTGLLATMFYGAARDSGLWLGICLKLGIFGGIVAAVFVTAGGLAEIQRVRNRT